MLSRTSHMSRVLHRPELELTRKIDVRDVLQRRVTIRSQLRLGAQVRLSYVFRTTPATHRACRKDATFTHVRSPMKSPSHWTRTGSGLVIVSIGTSSRRNSLAPFCSPLRLI